VYHSSQHVYERVTRLWHVMQVSVHMRGISECYECTPRPPPKGFPICTIRNTPDKPIHCIVWAKDLLFERLFGPPEVITDLDEQQEGRDDGEAEAGVPHLFCIHMTDTYEIKGRLSPCLSVST
jgi:hypothetical protein